MQSVVVGGQGFLGGAVVAELVSRGDRVTVIDRMATQRGCDERFGAGAVSARSGDVTDAESLRDAFTGAEEVYNFAGLLGTSELDETIGNAIQANVTGAVNVFQAARAQGVKVVFHPSKPHPWLNTYTITKYAAEQFGRLYSGRGLRVSCLRYFNAYGPWQPIAPVRKIIPTFARQAARREPLTIYGSGEQTVDMIYSDDLARITVEFVRSGYDGDPLDLGRGVELSVNQVAADVNAYFHNGGRVTHLPMRAGETPETKLVASIEPLRRVLGELRFQDWSESLAHTLEWYARRFGRPSGPTSLRVVA